jgi:RHS repeat-associated protein
MKSHLHSYSRRIVRTFLLVLLGCLFMLMHTPAKADCSNSAGATSACSASSNPATLGNSSGTEQGAGNPINVITGNKYQEEVDMPALPGELGIEIVRHYNSSIHALGHMGYGWRLSYETDLYVVNNTMQIVEADGSRIIFARDANNPSLCATNNPANGQLHIEKTAKGDEYLWVWQSGRKLHFNHKGKLERITSNTGASVTLLRGPRGELLRVKDPQGRSLDIEYASLKSKGFKGIVAIKSPVGRFTYTYENDTKQLGISNLLSVQYPDATTTDAEHAKSQYTNLVRHYHYGESSHTAPINQEAEDGIDAAERAHLLTGITLAWKNASGKDEQQSINTWAYDAQGRGILSVKGLEKVTLRYIAGNTPTHQHNASQPNTHQHIHPTSTSINITVLTNNLGQTTTYEHALIAGEYRLLSVRGAGCSSCGEPNIQYHYDAVARLTDITKLDSQGNPLYAQHIDRDALGRTVKLSRIGYQNGKAQPTQLIQRFEYAQTKIPKSAQKTIANDTNNLPILFAKPSVVAGKEHQWKMQYNAYGQPVKIIELGFKPALPTDKTSEPTAMTRTITYTYSRINGKSLLTQQDGPLPNGKTNTPQDSDITQYQYDKHGQYLTKFIAPNNIITRFEYDLNGLNHSDQGGTGRVITSIANDAITTNYSYNTSGKLLTTQRYPASLSLVSAKGAGLLQSTAMAYDVFGNTTMIKRVDGQAVFMQYSKDGKLTKLDDGFGNRVEWKDWNKGNTQDTTHTVTTQQWFTAEAPNTVDRAWYFWHDNQNRLTQRLSPDGGLDTWQYSDADQVAPFENRWVKHIDPLNRMILNLANIHANVQVRMTPTGYLDAHLQLNTLVGDAEKVSTHNTNMPMQISDDFGRVVLFSSIQHGTYTAQYDANNHIQHIQQADGTQIQYTYDLAGRMLSKTAIVTKTLPNQVTDTVRYNYNAFGLTEVKDSVQTITYTKDLLGRELDKATTFKLQNGQHNTYHIRTRYDALGHVHAKQLIDGQWLVFTLDDKTGLTKAIKLHSTIWPSFTNKLADWLNLPNLPLKIASKETVVTDITVHPFNGITHLTHGNGISDDNRFDLAGRLTTVSHGNPSRNNKANSPFIQASYTYDAGRRLISEKIDTANMQGKVKEYAYTGWNQLATPPQAGFMHAVANHAATNNTANNAMTKSEQTAQDQAGRTTSDAQYRYSYNVWGKLTNVHKKNTNTIVASYQNNALGERVMASYPTAENTQTRYYLYNHQQRVAELDGNGQVLQQYVYVNQSLVAVINTRITSNDHSEEDIIAIHTDRRNAPVAATDEDGKVIWQAEYDAWGKVIPVSNIQQIYQNHSFNISLRLPGQWQDQATGLYYNYQRDYNPDTGRYLTPDPLGFPDGADPYAYVNNDPLNKIDPLGLYQIDIHYYMTYFLGVMAGLSEYQAHVVALGAQYVDDNPYTAPLPHTYTQAAKNIALENPAVVNRLASYHFTQAGYDKLTGTITDVIDRVKNPENPQLTRLLSAANANYKGAPCKVIKEQLFGEYLHAFEDAFGHRDQDNVPIEINGGFGHGLYGHEPDKTYSEDVTDAPAFLTKANGLWWTRELRTLEMEKEVFAKIQQNFGVSAISKVTNQKITIDTIATTLEKFNSTHESEESTNNLFVDTQKLKVLNDFLIKNGFSTIPIYNVAQACLFRQNTVVELAGNPPPGVILVTPLNCTSVR